MLQTGSTCFLYRGLDQRFVGDREHLLGHGFSGGEEANAIASGEEEAFVDHRASFRKYDRVVERCKNRIRFKIATQHCHCGSFSMPWATIICSIVYGVERIKIPKRYFMSGLLFYVN